MEFERIISEEPIEWEWLDEKANAIRVLYSNWDSMELLAIVAKGKLVRKGILAIEHYSHSRSLAVVRLQGLYMQAWEQIEYNISDDDERVGVVNLSGGFFIPPIYSSIAYEPREGKFYCQRMNGKEEVI